MYLLHGILVRHSIAKAVVIQMEMAMEISQWQYHQDIMHLTQKT